jgi:hypothetical protein
MAVKSNDKTVKNNILTNMNSSSEMNKINDKINKKTINNNMNKNNVSFKIKNNILTNMVNLIVCYEIYF